VVGGFGHEAHGGSVQAEGLRETSGATIPTRPQPRWLLGGRRTGSPTRARLRFSARRWAYTHPLLVLRLTLSLAIGPVATGAVAATQPITRSPQPTSATGAIARQAAIAPGQVAAQVAIATLSHGRAAGARQHVGAMHGPAACQAFAQHHAATPHPMPTNGPGAQGRTTRRAGVAAIGTHKTFVGGHMPLVEANGGQRQGHPQARQRAPRDQALGTGHAASLWVAVP
jgi:hypothetical protein